MRCEVDGGRASSSLKPASLWREGVAIITVFVTSLRGKAEGEDVDLINNIYIYI